MRRELQVRRGLPELPERRVQQVRRGLQVHQAWPDEQEPAAAWSGSHEEPWGEQEQRDEPELQVRQVHRERRDEPEPAAQ